MNARQTIDALGGYRYVAKRIGKHPNTVHSILDGRKIPAAWFPALCALATEAGIEAPARDLFSFVELKPAPKSAVGSARDYAA